jgi:hypothetical protein
MWWALLRAVWWPQCMPAAKHPLSWCAWPSPCRRPRSPIGCCPFEPGRFAWRGLGQVREHPGGRSNAGANEDPRGHCGHRLGQWRCHHIPAGQHGRCGARFECGACVFQPVRVADREYVDGGLVAPVPVRQTREMGANFVIAVDISSDPEGNPYGDTFQILMQTFAIMGKSINTWPSKRPIG